MDFNSKLLEYSNEIPNEIKLLLKALSTDDRLGILLALMKNGRMTFSQMKTEFDLSASSLSNHLTTLQNGNLIENFYEKGTERAFSYYDVTDIPEAFFDSLFDIMFKTTEQKEDHQELGTFESSRFLEAGASSIPERVGSSSRTIKKTRNRIYQKPSPATISDSTTEITDVRAT